jgi:hypothetical protein
VGLGEAGEDGGVVVAQAVGEAMQVGLAVGVERGDPGVEPVAVAFDEPRARRHAGHVAAFAEMSTHWCGT